MNSPVVIVPAPSEVESFGRKSYDAAVISTRLVQLLWKGRRCASRSRGKSRQPRSLSFEDLVAFVVDAPKPVEGNDYSKSRKK